MEIVYKIENGYPIIDTLPAIDETFLAGTKDGDVYTPQELQDAIDALKNQEVLDAKLQEAQQYLNSTDWYYARKAETGEEVPTEIVVKRQEAREFIRNNK